MRTIISLGLAAGVMNLALPARAGDLAAIAFMERECKVHPSVGTAAVGVTSFLEAALFGFFLLAVMGLGAARWSHLVGDSSTANRLDLPEHWTGLCDSLDNGHARPKLVR